MFEGADLKSKMIWTLGIGVSIKVKLDRENDLNIIKMRWRRN